MEEKMKILKFKFDGKEGFLSVIVKPEVYYALVQKDTPKVKDVEDTNKLQISYDIKKPEFKDVFVTVSNDKKLIKSVYNQLEIEKNLYFKQLDDTLCVLEIEKE